MNFTQTVTAKLSATQRAALAAVERAEGSSVSELVRHALVKTYRLDAIAEKMLMTGADSVGEPSEEEVGSNSTTNDQ
jgi:DNA-binding MarR family transcriptional regulator